MHSKSTMSEVTPKILYSGRKSPNKSPHKTINGVKLYNFSELKSYRHISKPWISQQKKQNIILKANLDKKTKHLLQKRIKNNDLFYNYDFNPFKNVEHTKSVIQTSNRWEQRQLSFNKKKHTASHIIQEMSEKKKLRKYSQFQQFKQNKEKLLQLHANNIKINKRAAPKHKSHLNSYKQQSLENDKQTNNILSIDQIIKIQEQNYFWKEISKINVKQIIKKKYDQLQKNNILIKMNFCFQIKMQKNKSQKIDINLHLGQDSRKKTHVKKERRIFNYMQTFSLINIGFETLINLSAGRQTPDIAYTIINGLDLKDDYFIDINHNKGLHYNQNSENKCNLAETPFEDRQQISKYKQIPLKPEQQRYKNTNIYRKQSINNKLQKAKNLALNTINDIQLHKNLQLCVMNELQVFVEDEKKYPKDSIERNRLVRLKKNEKIKKERLKIQQLVETFKMKRNSQKFIKQIKK